MTWRGRFFTEARRLVEVLLGRATPSPRRRFPLSPQMALLWASLLFCTVIAGVGATLGWDISQVYRPVHAGSARIGLTTALANVLVGAGLIAAMVRLFRRTASPSSLREGLAQTSFSLLLSLIGTLMVDNRSYREAAGPDARTDSAWLYFAAGAVALFAFVLVSRSRAIHLEMPTGRGATTSAAVSKATGSASAACAGSHMWAIYRPKIDELKKVTGVGSTATYQVRANPGTSPSRT